MIDSREQIYNCAGTKNRSFPQGKERFFVLSAMDLTLHLKKEGLSLGLTHRGQGSEAVIQPLHPSGDAGPIEVVSRPKIDSLIVVAEGCAVGKEGVEAQIPVQPAEESGALLPGERLAGGKKSAAYPLDKARIVGPGDRLGDRKSVV